MRKLLKDREKRIQLKHYAGKQRFKKKPQSVDRKVSALKKFQKMTAAENTYSAKTIAPLQIKKPKFT
jgi:hypothetical protein